jgi:hypothetical protein
MFDLEAAASIKPTMDHNATKYHKKLAPRRSLFFDQTTIAIVVRSVFFIGTNLHRGVRVNHRQPRY